MIPHLTVNGMLVFKCGDCKKKKNKKKKTKKKKL